jgi:hypothetical protein
MAFSHLASESDAWTDWLGSLVLMAIPQSSGGICVDWGGRLDDGKSGHRDSKLGD